LAGLACIRIAPTGPGSRWPDDERSRPRPTLPSNEERGMGWLIGRSSMSVVLPFEVCGPFREVASRVGFLALLAMPLLSGGCLTQAMWMSALEDVKEGGPRAVHPESVIGGAIDANDEVRLAVDYDDGATVMLRVARDRLARAGADAEPP